MQSPSSSLPTNSIAFIGLCNEYCNAVTAAAESEPADFIAEMLRLLPRIYIAASDLPDDQTLAEEGYIDDAMDETSYTDLRDRMAAILGADDTYLETFEEDMKYSDTPIAASISENLADIMQVTFNFISTIRQAPVESIPAILATVKEDFTSYWSRILCNVLRPLNHLRYNS